MPTCAIGTDNDGTVTSATERPARRRTYAQPGTIAMADFDRGAFHRTQPITMEHVQVVLRRISGADVTLTALRLATTWTDRARQATAYRNGRVISPATPRTRIRRWAVRVSI